MLTDLSRDEGAAVVAAIPFPILERIPIVGDVAISPHGIGIALGVLAGALLMIRRAELRGLARTFVPDIREQTQQLLGWALVGAIVGARLFFVLTHSDVYLRDPLAILRVYEGGLTLLGGLAGAVLLGIPIGVRRGYRPLMLLDSAVPGIALGLVVGRVGDLLIGDHIGPPAGGFPLAWRCTGNYWERLTNSFGYVPPQPYPAGGQAPTAGCFDVAVHQTALYDFLAAAVVLGLLLWFERQPRFDGFFMATFVYAYGALRFLSDFARQDRTWIGLTGSQWAIVATIAAVTVFLAVRRPWHRRPWAWDLRFEHPWLTPPEQGAVDEPSLEAQPSPPDASEPGPESDPDR